MRLFFLHLSSLLPFTRGERHLFDNHPFRPQTSSEAFEIQKLQLFRQVSMVTGLQSPQSRPARLTADIPESQL